MKRLLLICLFSMQISAWDWCCRRRKSENLVQEFANIISKNRMNGLNPVVVIHQDYTLMIGFPVKDQAIIANLLERASKQELVLIQEVNQKAFSYFKPLAPRNFPPLPTQRR